MATRSRRAGGRRVDLVRKIGEMVRCCSSGVVVTSGSLKGVFRRLSEVVDHGELVVYKRFRGGDDFGEFVGRVREELAERLARLVQKAVKRPLSPNFSADDVLLAVTAMGRVLGVRMPVFVLLEGVPPDPPRIDMLLRKLQQTGLNPYVVISLRRGGAGVLEGLRERGGIGHYGAIEVLV